jgi:hypothetical protein
MLSGEVDDEMLPSIFFVYGPASASATLCWALWQIYYNKNAFFVGSRYLCELKVDQLIEGNCQR